MKNKQRTSFRMFNIILLTLIIASCAHSQTSLFNGKNLDGWTNYGTEKWYVEDNQIICESGPDALYGYLGTDKHYKSIK